MHCNKGRTAKVNCNIELRRRRHKHRLPLNVDQWGWGTWLKSLCQVASRR